MKLVNPFIVGSAIPPFKKVFILATVPKVKIKSPSSTGSGSTTKLPSLKIRLAPTKPPSCFALKTTLAFTSLNFSAVLGSSFNKTFNTGKTAFILSSATNKSLFSIIIIYTSSSQLSSSSKSLPIISRTFSIIPSASIL